eukprot:4465339-Karenia_brevis.AAC.1
MKPHKNKVWFPALDNVEDEGLRGGAAALGQLVPRCRGGLALLGSAAQGDLEVHLAGDAVLTGPAAKRAAAAELLLTRIS